MAKHRLQEIKYQIQHAPILLKVSQWYQGLPEREQKIFYWLGVLLAVALVFSLIWAPAEKAKTEAEKKLQKELSLHQWMQDNAHKVKGRSHAAASSDGSLLGTINESARKHTISLTRFEPDGDTGVRIWLENAVFDNVMAWVQDLEQQGVLMSQFNADREEQGKASFRMTFRR